MRIEQARVVRAPREHVFRIWTDYEAWPRFSSLYTRVSVEERGRNTASLGIEVKVFGRKTWRTERHILTPPEQVRVEGETEGATSTTTWRFEPVGEGTLVTALVVAELKGLAKLVGPFARQRAGTLLREWIEGFATFVEAT
jgi:ribosome-associated toxin RatA of RatAB toxin-antitoxin module